MDLWQPLEIPVDHAAHYTIGPLEFWVRHATDEWRVAVRHGTPEQVRACRLTTEWPETDWRRWAGNTAGHKVRAVPLLPDRPVVVRPAFPLSILPGEEARFYVGIVLWIRITLTGAPGDVKLCEEYTQQLSNTWFGTPTEGEFCYALQTRARQHLDRMPPAPHRAICPLLVRNRSGAALEVQKLCLRAGHLGVYQGRQHLWTAAAVVTHRGGDAASEVEYAQTPPEYEPEAQLLSAARQPQQRGFMQRMFAGRRAAAQG